MLVGPPHANRDPPVNTYNARTPAVPCNLPADAFPHPVKGFLSIPRRFSAVNENQLRLHYSGHYAAAFATTAQQPVVNETCSLLSVLSYFGHSGPARSDESSKKILQVPIPVRVCAIGMVNITKD